MTSGAKESDNHAGILIHGTDVSASYSQLPVNQLDSFSEFNMNGLGGVKKSSNESVNRHPEAQIDKMQVFAAGLQAKDCTKEGQDGVLIVGGGEIGVIESSNSDGELA